jgi:hypothetical protein
LNDATQSSHPPAYRIEHRRSDVAPGIVGYADDLDAANTLAAELRRQLVQAGADGILVLIAQGEDPERIISSHRVDNRVTPRAALEN